MLAGLVLLGVDAGSFSFEQLAVSGPHLSSAVRGVCFALLFAGFAVKAALIPLQTWLPGAYGGTDADSSGFVAAVSLNVAFYAMLRMWFGFLGHPAVWWAVVALLVGALTALIGILGGILQREFRLFVAYSSIENSGLIVTDLGLALMGKAQHRPGLIGVGLIAAAFQITAHSVAKAGLFASVAAVEHSTGTSDMERLGGLYRRLPTAAIATLAGGAALAALPPFSGFVSEWLGLEALMQGFRVSGAGSHLAIALAGALVALTAGLAALAFVRATGMTFLGMPRDRSIEPRPSRVRRGGGWVCSRSARWRSASRRRGWSRCSSTDCCRSAAPPDRPHQPAGLAGRAWVRGLRQHQPDRARAHAHRVCPRRRLHSPPRQPSPRPACAGVGFGCGGHRASCPVHGDRLREHGQGDLQRRLPRANPAADDRRSALPRAAQHDARRTPPVRPGLALPADHRRVHPGRRAVRNIQAGPLGLYLLYLLLAFVALLLIAPRLG